MNVMTDQEALEYDVGEDEKPVTISLEEAEAPQENEAPEEAHEPEQKAAPTESELDRVSEQVQRRIDKLTARMREAQRREQAAIEYAQGLQRQTQELNQRLHYMDDSRLHESKNRIDTQLMAIKQVIAKARDEGDIDTEIEAQERLASLINEQQQLAGYEVQRKQQPVQQAIQQPIQQPIQQQRGPSVKAESWAEKNQWFGSDRVMTHAAWGIHQQLIEEEGFDPESDEYYDELDSRIRNEFPHKFEQQNRKPKNVQSVAPATRASGVTQSSARRTVKLSPSQVAIARKLGVPLEEYAKYVKE
jgi:hypothetical protein